MQEAVKDTSQGRDARSFTTEFSWTAKIESRLENETCKKAPGGLVIATMETSSNWNQMTTIGPADEETGNLN